MAQQIPPYVSYRTFHNFLSELHSQGLPSRIDRSVMAHKSGTIQSQLLLALEYLGLITAKGLPTDRLRQLLESRGAEQRKIRRQMLEEGYDFLLSSELDLSRATSREVEEIFRSTGASGETVRRAISFFLRQAKEAGMKVSPYIKPHRNKSSSTSSSQSRAEESPKTDEIRGKTHRLQLQRGGNLEICLNIDWFEVSQEDRDFVLELIDLIRKYRERME